MTLQKGVVDCRNAFDEIPAQGLQVKRSWRLTCFPLLAYAFRGGVRRFPYRRFLASFARRGEFVAAPEAASWLEACCTPYRVGGVAELMGRTYCGMGGNKLTAGRGTT